MNFPNKIENTNLFNKVLGLPIHLKEKVCLISTSQLNAKDFYIECIYVCVYIKSIHMRFFSFASWTFLINIHLSGSCLMAFGCNSLILLMDTGIGSKFKDIFIEAEVLGKKIGAFKITSYC